MKLRVHVGVPLAMSLSHTLNPGAHGPEAMTVLPCATKIKSWMAHVDTRMETRPVSQALSEWEAPMVRCLWDSLHF